LFRKFLQEPSFEDWGKGRERKRIPDRDNCGCHVWWHTPVIPVLGKLRQED
jgi:hypothetical protein